MITLRKLALCACLLITSHAFAWYEEFTTKIGPVIHGDNFVNVGGFMQGKEINISCKSFNGVPLKAPLILQVWMTRDEFVEAMRAIGIID